MVPRRILRIRVLPDRPAGFRERFNARAEALCVSDVALYGAERPADPPGVGRAVEQFAWRMAVLAFGSAAAGHAAEIRADLERSGCVIGPYDAIMAGHARRRGLVVVTGNGGAFGRVQGLRWEDWG